MDRIQNIGFLYFASISSSICGMELNDCLCYHVVIWHESEIFKMNGTFQTCDIFQDIFLCLCWYECAPLVYWIVRVISQPSVRARNLALRQWELIYEIWEHISDCILTSFHQWNQKKIRNKLKYLKIFGCFMRDLAWGFPDSNLLTYYNSILNG